MRIWLPLLALVLFSVCTSMTEEGLRDTNLYVGYLFNISVTDCSKVSLPGWISCQGNQVVGLPLDSQYGVKLILSFEESVTYIFTVKYCHPWWSQLSQNEKSQMFLSGLRIRKRVFVNADIERQIRFISAVRSMMSIDGLQRFLIIPSDRISSTILYVTSSPTKSVEDTLTLIWSVGEDSISNDSLKSLQILESKFAKETLEIETITIEQWFVGFTRHQNKMHYRRSVANSELIALIEGSGYTHSEKANQFIKRTTSLMNTSNPSDLNNTLPSSWPVLLSPLLPIKMNALQIMNYVIPENTFEDKSLKVPLKINVFFDNNSLVSNDPTRWISFNDKDQNVRINPKLLNIGETVLKVCAHNAMDNYACDKLTISVSSPPPQNHQIYVSKSHKDYTIRYTIPLAWFNRFGVKTRDDIFVEKATGNSPFDWDSAGNLEILDIASLEGKLIELILKVLIRNESQISIHLTLPVVAINRQKITSGPLYRSYISFRPDNLSEKKTHFQIRDFWGMLKQLAQYIGKFLDDMAVRVQIFSPIKSPMYFDKIPGQRDEVVVFDWFFHADNGQKNLCLNKRLDKIEQELLFRSFSSFLMINLTILENRFGWVCPYDIRKETIAMRASEPIRTESTAVPTPIILRSKSDEEIIQRFFPNFQYTNFTVTAGLAFKSYIFRKINFDKKNIKEMRLVEPTKSTSESWIALSSNNDFLYGLPLQTHVRETPYKLRFIVMVVDSRLEYNIDFLVNVVTSEHQPKSINHHISITMKVEQKIKIDMDYRWRLVTQLDKYVREKCETANDCGKDLVLLEFEVAKSAYNASYSRVTANISFLSLLAMDSRHCPKLNLIRLYDKVYNTASSSNLKKTNFALKYLFSKCSLGEVSGSDIILTGICKGVDLQPPDLGQITIYAMVPFHQSLRQLCLFYNTSVWFTIIYDGSSKSGNPYHDWISINEESTSLVGIAMPSHVRPDPYLLELVVHSNTVRQLISPRIAVTVRALKEHPLFNPYIHQPNHQIVFTLESIPKLTHEKNYLLLKFQFSKLTDQYFRSQCIKNGYISSIPRILPCGSDLVFQNISKMDSSETITFKFSIISELSGERPDVNRQGVSMNGFHKFCPIDKLLKLQRGLLGDNGSVNSPAVLPTVIHYYYKANIGKVKDIKFEFLGPCSKYQYSRNPGLSNEVTGLFKSSQSQPKSIGDDRHMFLMATIVPTCSFIIISLCVGLLVACCLQRRNQKFQLTFNHDQSSVEFAVRGGTSPIILAGEYQHSYMPPSRPLILPNEKPPVAPPDYIAENNSLILVDEDT